jgi:hypothetical protein
MLITVRIWIVIIDSMSFTKITKRKSVHYSRYTVSTIGLELSGDREALSEFLEAYEDSDDAIICPCAG